MTALYHLVDAHAWDAAVAIGRYAPASLDEEGFVHCSFAGQVERVANALYPDVDGLVAVELDPARLTDVRVEDSYAAGEEFPHVYGPIPTTAAVAVHPVRRTADGQLHVEL